MKRSKFSLSNYKLLTCDMGELVPIGCFEVLPGDTVQQATSALIRVSPLLAPVMHPVRVRIHHWFVPNRILWDGWEDFITGGPDGMDSQTPPFLGAPVTQGSLADYLGVPPGYTGYYSSLPFRAYNMIWNEFYRDQDLQQPVGEENTTLLRANWEKDYFTTARPWTQKGPDVSLPISGVAPVVTTGANIGLSVAGGPDAFWKSTSGNLEIEGSTATGRISFGTPTGLQADLTQTTAVNINDLRKAFALQRYEEARARYGSRYTEYLRYLGVRSSDARLQRPEYLGGGKQTIQFSEVLQTGPGQASAMQMPEPRASDINVVGDLKGHGIGALRSNRYRRFFEEHGIVLTLMSVLPKTIYAQGVPRLFSRATKEEYFQKELQHIGQQEVYNREIYAVHSSPAGVFGYQDRYDEYRRQESGIAGDFRSTLDHWHYARIFASDPTLNGSFVEAIPTKRPNAVQSEDVLWVMANHSVQARRLVAASGTSYIL